ncbi:hypothetical protein BMAJHU_B0739, partial [Burkholderia mallei JHU]
AASADAGCAACLSSS